MKTTNTRRWRREVEAFADAMEAQLRANDHKGGWKMDKPEDLFVRLTEEASELDHEIAQKYIRETLFDPSEVVKEAADVANFAMMIADVCGALRPTPSAANSNSAKGPAKPLAPPRPLRIYIASSWRNEHQPGVVQALRAAGHEVYDFRNPHPTGPDRGRRGVGFSWSEISPNWQSWTPSEYAAALSHPAARDGFGSDMDALRWCDWCVMVQPCGRSSALELGWAVGAGRRTAVLLAPGQEPELMLRMADFLVTSIDDLHACLKAGSLPA